MNRGESDLATDWEALPTGAIARGCLTKQPEKTELRQLKLGRLFSWPADQPRHAIRTSSIRSIPVRPLRVGWAGSGQPRWPPDRTDRLSPGILRNRTGCIGPAAENPEFLVKKPPSCPSGHRHEGILARLRCGASRRTGSRLQPSLKLTLDLRQPYSPQFPGGRLSFSSPDAPW